MDRLAFRSAFLAPGRVCTLATVLAALVSVIAACSGDGGKADSDKGEGAAGDPAPPAPSRPAAVDAGEDPAIRASALRRRADELRKKRDGAGCLRALDAAHELTAGADGARRMTYTRAACEILAGQCDEGTEHLGEYLAATMPEAQALDKAREMALILCPTDRGPWRRRFRRLDFQSGEAWQKKDRAWCETLKRDLAQARADAGKAIDQEARGRARRAGYLVRKCLAQSKESEEADTADKAEQ